MIEAAKGFLSPATRGTLRVAQYSADYYSPHFCQGRREYSLSIQPGNHPDLPPGPTVELGGEMCVNLSSREEAWKAANYIAEACGYMARKVQREGLRGIEAHLAEGPAMVAWWDAEGFVGVQEVGA